MKTRLLLALVVCMAALGAWYFGGSAKQEGAIVGDEAEVAVVPPPTSTVTDEVEVFQKAFWKRPTPEDRILHARLKQIDSEISTESRTNSA